MKSIRYVSIMGVMSPHRLKGKKANWITNDTMLAAPKQHFEYLLQLGKVRATRTMGSVVDGVQVGQINCGGENDDEFVDMVLLPPLWLVWVIMSKLVQTDQYWWNDWRGMRRLIHVHLLL